MSQLQNKWGCDDFFWTIVGQDLLVVIQQSWGKNVCSRFLVKRVKTGQNLYIQRVSVGFSPVCPVPSSSYKGKLCSCSLLMWQHLSPRCCQTFASSTESSTGAQLFFVFNKISNAWFHIYSQSWCKPRLRPKLIGTSRSLRLPLKWKIGHWWSSVALGGIHLNKNWMALFFFSIWLNSDQESTPALRCVAEFGTVERGQGQLPATAPQPPTTLLQRDPQSSSWFSSHQRHRFSSTLRKTGAEHSRFLKSRAY